MPAAMKRRARRAAAVVPTQWRQPSATGAEGTAEPCAILSSMLNIVALLGLCLVAGAQAQTADLIVENAQVYTVNKAQPEARALAIKDGRILAVGADLT